MDDEDDVKGLRFGCATCDCVCLLCVKRTSLSLAASRVKRGQRRPSGRHRTTVVRKYNVRIVVWSGTSRTTVLSQTTGSTVAMLIAVNLLFSPLTAGKLFIPKTARDRVVRRYVFTPGRWSRYD